MPNIIHSNCIRVFLLLACLQAFSLSVFAQKTEARSGFKYKKGYYYLLNKKGKVNKSIEPFTYAEPFNEGLALVEKDLKFGFINNDGKDVIPCKFYNLGRFSNGLAYASSGNKYGYIDKTGEYVIEPQFEMAHNFNGDYAMVLKPNPDTIKYGSYKLVFGYINKKGQLIGDSYYTSINYNSSAKNFSAKIGDSSYTISEEGKITSTSTITKLVYIEPEEIPQYPGGGAELRKSIAHFIRYPISAQVNGLKGRVYIQFIVGTDGMVIDAYPVCKEHPILMKEAERVVRKLNYWKPGTQDGKPVKVSYVVPINFALK